MPNGAKPQSTATWKVQAGTSQFVRPDPRYKLVKTYRNTPPYETMQQIQQAAGVTLPITSVDNYQPTPWTGFKKQAQEALNNFNWTLKFSYVPDLNKNPDPNAPPTFNEIKSKFQRDQEDIDHNVKLTRGNTSLKDWTDLGNIQFTFFYMAIDGFIPSAGRGFLSNATYYAEYAIDDTRLSNIWVSTDLLPEVSTNKNLTGFPAYRGTAPTIKAKLIDELIRTGRITTAIGITKEKVGQKLDELMGKPGTTKADPKLEVKLPGSIQVDQWHPKT